MGVAMAMATGWMKYKYQCMNYVCDKLILVYWAWIGGKKLEIQINTEVHLTMARTILLL